MSTENHFKIQRISLKKLIRKSKNKPLWTVLLSLNEGKTVVIDPQDQLLFGEASNTVSEKYPIELNGYVLGYVSGGNHADLVAVYMSDQAEREYSTKEIGSEVLGLYKEINLIYNFSEKLASAKNPKDVGDMVLSEASNIISATAGLVIMLDEKDQNAYVLSHFGESFINPPDLANQTSFWGKLIKNPQSDIENDLPGSLSVKSVIHAPLKVQHRQMGCILLAHEDKVDHSAADLKLLTTLALQTSSAIESAQLYERRIREAEEREQAMREVHNVTMKFVPYDFIKSLGKEKLVDVQLGDQVQREVTVLFLDIRDFTSLSEKMTPEENFQFVTSFNKRLGPIIRQYGGFINQYLGDGIMAIFPDSAAKALRASIDILNSLKRFNQQQIENDLSPIRIGIGMHTGPLIMGITGDAERLDAATISDAVNTASRIESLSKHFGVSILLSEATLSLIENKVDFQFRYLGKVQVKGKQKPVKIYECFNGDPPDVIQEKIETLATFKQGLKFYYQRDFTEASQAFEQVLVLNPFDKPSKLFQGNAEAYAKKGVSKEWEGVELMDRK